MQYSLTARKDGHLFLGLIQKHIAMCEMEMPTPCRACGEVFDLLDGYGSDKWYPNTIICKSCFEKEQLEIEKDDEIEELKEQISDAEVTIKDAKQRLAELGVEL